MIFRPNLTYLRGERLVTCTRLRSWLLKAWNSTCNKLSTLCTGALTEIKSYNHYINKFIGCTWNVSGLFWQLVRYSRIYWQCIYLVRIQDVIGDIVAFQPANNGGNIFFSGSKQICEVLNGKILTVLRWLGVRYLPVNNTIRIKSADAGGLNLTGQDLTVQKKRQNSTKYLLKNTNNILDFVNIWWWSWPKT